MTALLGSIQLLTKLAADWTADNPTLLMGQVGFEIDTYRFKIGTGAAPWNSLQYYGTVLQVTGTALLFDKDRNYGTVGAPEAGDITVSIVGARLGVTVIIIHNNGSAPSFDSKFKKLSGSGDYVTGQINYIVCQYINDTEIVYSISQRA